MAKDELLGVDEAAAVLRVAPATLFNWRSRGEGPLSFKVGRLVRYRREELERWLKAQERATGRGDSVAS